MRRFHSRGRSSGGLKRVIYKCSRVQLLWTNQYRYLLINPKTETPSESFLILPNFATRWQISFVEIGDENIRDFQKSGNPDYPFSDYLGPTCTVAYLQSGPYLVLRGIHIGDELEFIPNRVDKFPYMSMAIFGNANSS